MSEAPIIVLSSPAPATQFVTREVHEHRAPTDASVQLLREMEQAAEAKRIAGMRLENNNFKGVVEVFRRVEDFSTVAAARFDLNGKRLTAQIHDDGFADATPELMVKLRDEMARVIASEVLGELTRRMPR